MDTTVAQRSERSSSIEVADAGRVAVCGRLDNDHRATFGQFLTPPHIARFIATFISYIPDEIILLDPGAGVGALTAAFVAEVLHRPRRPRAIRVDVFEIEPRFQSQLALVLEACGKECARVHVAFEPRIYAEDFIEATADILAGVGLFHPRTLPDYSHVIMNPPYRKLHAQSQDRTRLRRVGMETSNYYTAFMWLATRLLKMGGEFISINPRSFCNGPYFKPFRKAFLDTMMLRRLHVFDSRSAAFREDDVLQENVIVHAIKSSDARNDVIISSSNGISDSAVFKREVPYHHVVSPSDPEKFIHLVVDDAHIEAKAVIEELPFTLNDLGLNVSTGRVVDFRVKQYLRQEPGDDTVPLIYPCHFDGGYVRWPKPGGRKPNAIVNDESTRELLVPSAVYVLVKRFTSKEERRRLVASIYDPRRVGAAWVGFENHLNYFHSRSGGISISLAKGLSAFLNSTVLDTYFREFSGHTQVNATDLRLIRYPSRDILERIGREIINPVMSQAELDALVEERLSK